MTARLPRIGLLLAVLVVVGCAGDGSELVDDMMGSMTGGDGTLAWLQANVFGAICIECHVPAGPGPMPLDSEQVSFDNLVNVPSFELPLLRVAPGDPENSYLLHKVEGRPTIVGTRMPPPPRPQLTAEQIEAIRQWIADGAQR